MNTRGTLDVVGNWNDYKLDTSGDDDYTDATHLDQDRTHNLGNEIADIDETTDPAWVTPAWCARGNMTSGPDVSDGTVKRHFIYDSWNRLVEVKDGETVIQKNEYDGLYRRLRCTSTRRRRAARTASMLTATN